MQKAQQTLQQQGYNLQPDNTAKSAPNFKNIKGIPYSEIRQKVEQSLNMDNPTAAPGAVWDLLRRQKDISVQRWKQQKEYQRAFNLKKVKEAQQMAVQIGEKVDPEMIVHQIPILTSLFDDEVDLLEFIRSVNDRELRIILQNPNNTQVILKVKEDVLRDVENTCKSLEIDG